MPSLPEAIILVLAPFAPLLSPRVWLHAQLLLLGAILAPGARTVTAALRAAGLTAERRFTNHHRVLNRATWSGCQGSRILLSMLVTLLLPSEATIVLGADDTVANRVRTDTGGEFKNDREAVSHAATVNRKGRISALL